MTLWTLPMLHETLHIEMAKPAGTFPRCARAGCREPNPRSGFGHAASIPNAARTNTRHLCVNFR